MCQSMPCNGSQTTTNQPTTNTNNTNRSTTNNNKTREGSNKRTRCARLGLGLRLEDRLVLCSNIQCEHINQHHDYVAEWLRRWPRKPFRETGRRFKSCRSRLFFCWFTFLFCVASSSFTRYPPSLYHHHHNSLLPRLSSPVPPVRLSDIVVRIESWLIKIKVNNKTMMVPMYVTG
jgi:hypothetical protein